MRAGPSGPQAVTDLVSVSTTWEPEEDVTAYYLTIDGVFIASLNTATIAQALLTRPGRVGRLVVKAGSEAGQSPVGSFFTLQFVVNSTPVGEPVVVVPDQTAVFADMTTQVFEPFPEVIYGKGDVVFLKLVPSAAPDPVLAEVEVLMITYERDLIEPSAARE